MMALLHRVRKYSQFAQIVTCPSTQPIPDHSIVEQASQAPSVEVSKLQNGTQVLTESIGFPNSTFVGCLLDVGTRDETPYTSGVLNLLKQSYGWRTQKFLSKGLISLSGGGLSVSYDQEKTYFQGYCLEHDLQDFLGVMQDCVFGESSSEEVNQTHKQLLENLEFKRMTQSNEDLLKELSFKACFGSEGLGLPLEGQSVEQLTHSELTDFCQKYFLPNNLIVCAAGVKDHSQFVDSAKPLFEVASPKELPQREKAGFFGGEIREKVDSDMAYVNLSYEAACWSGADMPAFQVLRTAVGEGGGFSTGGPGKGMHSRSYTHFLARYPFLESVQGSYSAFTDCGSFGITLVGLSHFSEHMAQGLIKELIELTRISDAEVNRAKNLLKAQILLTLEKTQQRLEEYTKMYLTFGKKPQELNYLEMIDQVTPEDVRKLVQNMLRTRPSLVVLGKDPNSFPSPDKFYAKLS